MKKIYRQGDVLIVAIDSRPAGLKRDRSKRIVLAEGEQTGHAHVLDAPAMAYRDKSRDLFFSLSSPARVVHEEHDPIALPAGEYRVIRQEEYRRGELIRVAD